MCEKSDLEGNAGGVREEGETNRTVIKLTLVG